MATFDELISGHYYFICYDNTPMIVEYFTESVDSETGVALNRFFLPVWEQTSGEEYYVSREIGTSEFIDNYIVIKDIGMYLDDDDLIPLRKEFPEYFL